MLVNTCFGTRDLDKAGKFYDAVMGAAGHARTGQSERSIYYGSQGQGAGFAVTLPYNGEPATNGNGTMATCGVADRATVDTMHAAALANGGSCEGPPGVRDNGFYVAYWRDPDGNKMNAVSMAG
jgi:catechol 2,3-dioxygenase-like lactoylglutathione lyase family enzyme